MRSNFSQHVYSRKPPTTTIAESLSVMEDGTVYTEILEGGPVVAIKKSQEVDPVKPMINSKK